MLFSLFFSCNVQYRSSKPLCGSLILFAYDHFAIYERNTKRLFMNINPFIIENRVLTALLKIMPLNVYKVLIVETIQKGI